MHIHLLEPYKSALILQAINEGLIQWECSNQLILQRLKKTISRDILSQTLQLCVLYDDISIFWANYDSKAKDLAKKHGLPNADLSGLKSLGIVNLMNVPSVIIEKERSKKLANISDVWKQNIEDIDLYENFVLSQISATGAFLDWSIYRLIRAYRLENYEALPLIQSVIPIKYKKLEEYFLKNPNSPELIANVDFVLISKAIELRHSFDNAIDQNSKVAGAPPIYSPTSSIDISEYSGNILWKIVVETLLGEGIEFPTPSSFKDILKLRESKVIQDFRDYLFQFMTSITSMEGQGINAFRREIVASLKAFKQFPRLHKMAKIISYASLPVGALEALSGIIGPSLVLGISALGLEALAQRWKKAGSWLYLSDG